MKDTGRIKELLNRIYGEDSGQLAFKRISPLIERFSARSRKKQGYFSQDDVILITYGDSIQTEGRTPIAGLHEFALDYLQGAISGIHFLPFFPYSSDGGDILPGPERRIDGEKVHDRKPVIG